jgi:hypothetical protein
MIEGSRQFFEPINMMIMHYDSLMNIPYFRRKIEQVNVPFQKIFTYIQGWYLSGLVGFELNL